MKRLQVGDECYVRISGVIMKTYWSCVVHAYLDLNRKTARLICPNKAAKELAK
jgi:hypothetical protein